MTPQEIHEECKAIVASVGAKADISVSLSQSKRIGGALISATCWPFGITGNESHTGYGNTFEEAFADLRAKLDVGKAERERKVIRAMALAIIQQTMDFGECTDAALRAEFSASDVEAFGPAAIEEANQLSENRPFDIVPMRGANAA